MKYEKKSEEYNKDVPAGYIISQDPGYMPNYNVKEGSTISVVVSLGQNLVKVPKVTGLTQDDATKQLEDLGLVVNVEETYSSKVEAGYVIEQSVKENEEIDAGESITIKVSKGTEKVTVPDLTGKTESEAKTAIKDAGLKLKTVVTTEDTTKEDGVVVKQSLEAGTEVEKNATITITINKKTVNKTSDIIIYFDKINNIEEGKKMNIQLEINGTLYNVPDSPNYSSDLSNIEYRSGKPGTSGTGTATVRLKINGVVYDETTLTYGETCTIGK